MEILGTPRCTCLLQVAGLVSAAYERLARLSIFVNAARYGELTSPHDRHHHTFERLFDRLEVDPAAGLYALLCALSELFHPLAGNQSDAALLGADVVDAIRAIRVHRPSNHAQRHLRDYSVASSVLRVARRLARDARQMAEQYNR